MLGCNGPVLICRCSPDAAGWPWFLYEFFRLLALLSLMEYLILDKVRSSVTNLVDQFLRFATTTYLYE